MSGYELPNFDEQVRQERQQLDRMRAQRAEEAQIAAEAERRRNSPELFDIARHAAQVAKQQHVPYDIYLHRGESPSLYRRQWSGWRLSPGALFGAWNIVNGWPGSPAARYAETGTDPRTGLALVDTGGLYTYFFQNGDKIAEPVRNPSEAHRGIGDPVAALARFLASKTR